MRAQVLCSLIGLALLACLVTPSFGDDSDAAEIRDVAHFAELKAAAPITTSDGWRLRLGLGDGGREGGPWRLLYCLANRMADSKSDSVKRHLAGESLGPVFYRVSHQATPRQRLSRVNVQLSRLPNEALYCQAIRVAWAGDYYIDLFASDGTLLAQQLLKVDEPIACYWQPCAEMRRRSELSSTPYVMCNSPVAATLSFSGLGPVWRRYANVETERGDGQIPLPGRLPSHPFWTRSPLRPIANIQDDLQLSLRLSMQDTMIVVDSPVKLINWPDMHLLARWWVNDRAVIPTRSDEVKQISLGRLMTYSKRLPIAFRLPASLGELKPSDKVSLQVLYSPDMIRQLPESRFLESLEYLVASPDDKSATVPLLSNRLEVEVTEELLS